MNPLILVAWLTIILALLTLIDRLDGKITAVAGLVLGVLVLLPVLR